MLSLVLHNIYLLRLYACIASNTDELNERCLLYYFVILVSFMSLGSIIILILSTSHYFQSISIFYQNCLK